MKKDYSYGIIPVYHKIAEVGDYYFLLVKNCNNSWSFPKGHAEAGETEEETAQRELFEETGVGSCEIIPGIAFSDRYTYDTVDSHNPNGEMLDKTVKFFLGMTDQYFRNIDGEEIIASRWLPYDKALEYLAFPGQKVLLTKVKEWLDNPDGQAVYGSKVVEQKSYQKVTQKALFVEEGKIFMACDQNDVWELPGGTLEMNEDLEDGFKRELKEELNLDSYKTKKIYDVIENKFSLGVVNFQFIMLIYKCEADLSNIKISNEHKEARWLTKSEISEFPMKETLRKCLLKIMK